MFPIKKNVLFVRFENIGDKFDYNSASLEETTIYIKVKEFAYALYEIANGQNAQLNNINIVETTLTGNQAYSEMAAKKVRWTGVDDALIKEPEVPLDHSDFEVALQLQRIRSFYIEYIPLAQPSTFTQ